MMFLLDAERKAWDACGRPAPGQLLLIGDNGNVLMTGSLKSPEPVLQEARRLGEIERDRRQAGQEVGGL